MDLRALKAELADPRYAGMDNFAAALDLNTPRLSRARLSLSGSEIFNAIDPAEFQALTAAQQARVRDVWGLGDRIDLRAGTNTRAVLLATFGALSATRANLLSAVTEAVSRAEELGLGRVESGHVEYARSAG